MVPGMKDSRGVESKTLSFVTAAFLVSTVKFAMAGHYGFPTMTGGEYSALVVSILGIWLGREWQARS